MLTFVEREKKKLREGERATLKRCRKIISINYLPRSGLNLLTWILKQNLFSNFANSVGDALRECSLHQTKFDCLGHTSPPPNYAISEWKRKAEKFSITKEEKRISTGMDFKRNLRKTEKFSITKEGNRISNWNGY